MDNAGYVALTRQAGLMREMQAVANNIANQSTAGFRREGLIFAEHVAALDGAEPSLSMASGAVRNTDLGQAPLQKTGGRFDFAIEGEGFFLLETPAGERLTRAGSFTPSAEGELVNSAGHRLLDGGGAPVIVPPGAGQISLAADGTLSADGTPVAQIGLFRAAEGASLTREGGVLFAATGEPEPAEGATLLQGFLEGSNVNPITEIARMIEVQRAYEMGASFLDKEDARIRNVLQTLGR